MDFDETQKPLRKVSEADFMQYVLFVIFFYFVFQYKILENGIFLIGLLKHTGGEIFNKFEN